ncbi:2Fe-2S iron-sulfur cluster-binding protein [Candidatus Chrysopegis kryptomonas]|uniref:NADH-quinone oxidoreductase subunit G n=1 Tax=Candidatus Chryseopegocella kryptomonas TaxID=1633643 RepID=A0A0P1N0Y5_9BACT|nr:2Fe-2S iron-sulfur cluster-binding protein [Candidatus Chrysopegis kryptomonas]CUT02080.1 NADH-quinone oxidoreductase subunit G [Candidatus Chrysopegis kryptomonas]
MAKITIDGKTVEVKDGLTILQAAQEIGIDIPHFCYHPALSIAGNCRMCLVEVEKMPKLAIACATRVIDGMVVYTQSEKVKKARQAVLEFILINHPLDCPICDEAGECKLQNYTYIYGPGHSRFEEEKAHKPKRVPLGPNIVLDVERCIMCSRCVRFFDEIVKDPQLTFTQRGDRVVLTTFPGKRVDNPYSMNIIDICPVGALTSKDFRFKERTWNMTAVESVCPGCARGCNVYLWVRNNQILRITPRVNLEVNRYWMCDYGRFTYKPVNSDDRIKNPMIKVNGELVETDWEIAVETAASILKSVKPDEVAVLGSAYATNEDNYLLQKFAKSVLKTKYVDFLRHVKDGDEDNFLIRADKTPNSYGAYLVGVRSNNGFGFNEIVEGLRTKKFKVVYVMDDDIVLNDEIYSLLDEVKVIVHATNKNKTVEKADVVFASASFAEKEGTFTNFEGRVQKINIAVLPKDYEPWMLYKPRKFGEVKPNTGEINKANLALSRLFKFGTQFDRWASGERRNVKPSWWVIMQVANKLGAKFTYASSSDVFKEISETIREFKGLSYDLIGDEGAMINKN